ncbi:MAG TPA: GntG family PLP-dependent aldolase [Bryobacteraceae bacterium]|nr:GntG family PLP-dependent aldolase [Bryobacteraceae bacterium]
MIDLRSDTVTKPTPEMRRAMADAEVGDDVYREDPTVNRLEERAAEILGKQAALFVPTGTMGNTIAVKLHTSHGEEVICEARGHVLNYELAMIGWFCGCVPRAIAAPAGILDWPRIEPHIKPLGPHWAPTGLVHLENTHNMAGGTVYPMPVLNEVCDRSHEQGLKVHLDGARIFNAAAHLNIPVATIAEKSDSVMFCLSKALGAPAGSMLVGSQEAMERGRLYRKRLGGGMRQAGVLAAAGLIALEQMPDRLPEDHANARLLADTLADTRGITVDLASVQTNIVIFDVSATGLGAAAVSAQLKKRGVLANAIGGQQLRMVTHYGVTRDMCRKAAETVQAILH